MVARDRWLAPDGLILPRVTDILVSGLSSPVWERRKAAWDDVYGFKMSVMRPLAQMEAVVDAVDAQGIMTTTETLKSIDANVANVEDLDFEAPFALNVTRDSLLCGIVCT